MKKLSLEEQISKIENQLGRKKPNGYLLYMVVIICLIYITDEIASNICTQMKAEVANTLFSAFGDSSLAKLETLALISYPCMAIALFYRTLSDRIGRKPFLIINTFGMGVGMFVIFLTNSIPGYILGYCIISFFVPHDMQVVYIMESAPAKHRAKIYSLIKCMATLGVMLIPLFRSIFMKEPSMWHKVFMIPAVIGLFSALLALMCSRETDAFLKEKLGRLKRKLAVMNSNTDLCETGSNCTVDIPCETDESDKTGFFEAFRYSMKNSQLRKLNILMGFFNLGFIITMNYQVMLSYGYASGVSASNGVMLDKALEMVSANEVTLALFLFPIGSGLIQAVSGFISDKLGRKKASLVMACTLLLSFLGFTIGSRMCINPYLAGCLSGICIGSFWAFGDINVMMMSESAPTRLRASVLSSCYVINVIGTFIGMGILIPVMNTFGNSVVDIVSGIIAIPGIVVAVIILMRTKETKGTEL